MKSSFLGFFGDFLKCLFNHFVWMAKAPPSVACFCCWNLCTWGITVVESTCLSLFFVLWWGSSGGNLKVGYLVYDECAACPWWSFERDMSLFVCWTSTWMGGNTPSSFCRHVCFCLDQRSSWAVWGDESGHWSVGRSMSLFFSAGHHPHFTAAWTSGLSSPELLLCSGVCTNSGTHVHSGNQNP